MAFEQRDNSGALFKNNRKTENRPDYRGKAKIWGVTFAISAWNRTARDGSKYLSLAFSEPPEQRREAEAEDDTAF